MRFSAVLLAAIALGCGTAEEDLGPKSLTAQLQLDPTSAAVGTSMTIRLVITHTGAETTTFAVLTNGASFRPFVKTPAGATVWVGNAGQPTTGPRQDITLANGDAYTATIVWPLVDSSGNPLPAGSYFVTTSLDATGLPPGFTEITGQVTITP